jgi:hypothetical protein
MTTMEIVYRYAKAPNESVALALTGICDVYGIRGIKFDREAQTICVGYDASRLNAATVNRLVRQAGLEIAEIVPLIPPQPPAPEPETTAAPA